MLLCDLKSLTLLVGQYISWAGHPACKNLDCWYASRSNFMWKSLLIVPVTHVA